MLKSSNDNWLSRTQWDGGLSCRNNTFSYARTDISDWNNAHLKLVAKGSKAYRKITIIKTLVAHTIWPLPAINVYADPLTCGLFWKYSDSCIRPYENILDFVYHRGQLAEWLRRSVSMCMVPSSNSVSCIVSYCKTFSIGETRLVVLLYLTWK